ncbi:MAG: VOC family protein [Saprospiraceae bacterium]|nr:VOC family protein [Bacteroidia bacterium]NNE14037.1 VOC family protein [Saprospiraceae bacterium]NNL92788.1 VOC family protein [Saprospiraceae bacterium]
MHQIDHIVLAVQNLDEAIKDFESKTGVTPITGGCHLNHGTKNAIVPLSNFSYLEIIAPDTDNKIFKGSRWMAVDKIQSPTITRWAMTSDIKSSFNDLINNYPNTFGHTIQGNRLLQNGQKLSWIMTKPATTPLVDPIPFLIDWSTSDLHPCHNKLPECGLIDFSLEFENKQIIHKLSKTLLKDFKLIHSVRDKINCIIDTPKGMVQL